MDDLIKSLKAHLYDRATSPLSGAFILSWIFWNWEIVLVAISDSYIYDKLFYLGNRIKESGIQNLLTYPLVSTFFVIVIYPIFSNLAYGASRWHQNWLNKIRVKYDDETPISKEEAAALKKEIYKTKEEYEKEIEKLREKIKYLESSNEEFSKTDNPAHLHNSTIVHASPNIQTPIEEKYEEEVYEILSKIAAGSDHITIKDITEDKDLDEKIKYETLIQDLRDMSCIEEKDSRVIGGLALSILQLGRKMLISMRDKRKNKEKNKETQ